MHDNNVDALHADVQQPGCKSSRGRNSGGIMWFALLLSLLTAWYRDRLILG